MRNKIVKFGSFNHAHGIMWNVVFDKKIPGTDFKGLSVFREFKDGPEWLVSDVHVAALDDEGKTKMQATFNIWQTRDQEALQICRLIANGAICMSALCEQGGIDGKMADLIQAPE